MKFHRRVWALLLAVLALLTVSVSASASEGFTFNWDTGRDDDSTEPHCKSLFMLNLDTDTVVYTLNPDEELPMASLTKIMTYIVAYETIPDIENKIITVPQAVVDDLEGTGSSLAGVAVGEQLTGLQLLNLLMIPSGNDAAVTLMEYVDGLYERGEIVPEGAPDPEDPGAPSDEANGDGTDGEPDYEENQGGQVGITDYTGKSYFIQRMNEKAQELGCKNTHFTNPHGLYHPHHYTTARDMAAIAKYAMTLPNFTEITGSYHYDKEPTNMDPDGDSMLNTNKLLLNFEDEASGINYFYTHAKGIKTGSHDEAGYCLAATASTYGYTYIVIALGNMDGYAREVHEEMLDVRTLFRWAFTSLEKKTVVTQGDILSSVKLEYAFQKDELLLASNNNISVMLPNSVDSSSIIVTVDKPESIQAPVRKGEVIGTATISYADGVIGTVEVVAAESVARSDLVAGWEQGRALLTSPWFIAIMAVIGALVVVYLILVVFYRRKQRQLRRVKKFRNL